MGVKIYAMILFDCVNETNTGLQGAINRGDASKVVHAVGYAINSPKLVNMPSYFNPRSIITGNLMIPSNVENCVHYIRSDDTNSRSDTMAKYNGGASDKSTTSYKPLYFKATHGGLGGLPYFTGAGEGNNIPFLEPGSAFAANLNMAEDIRASRDVAQNATSFCSRLGIPCALTV